MSDFTSGFWSFYISIITIASIIACGVLLQSMTTRKVSGSQQAETTGHSWDEDLVEYNNPLPRWWIWLFYITILFALSYLVLYPGLGTYAGLYHWTSTKQYREEVARENALTAPIFAKYEKTGLEQLAAEPEAMALGQKLFLNNCSQCHSSDARGGRGFPNLTDAVWIYGGSPETIEQTITNGRQAVMPPWGAVLGKEGVKDVANYVMSLNGLSHDSARAARGKVTFATICAACHGPDAKGNPAIGAENLTTTALLYGADEATLIETISDGHTSTMPAQKERLGEAKVHILAAYVWSLSHSPGAAAPPVKTGER
ncbi:MAG TPA: cytochrome-c oxidase, cbb3-type subunit III [Burkholderiales bacterium]|nr:cytochrome-c oxidase, cbb3-type subunit III [Burkholderiales bacterium]